MLRNDAVYARNVWVVTDMARSDTWLLRNVEMNTHRLFNGPHAGRASTICDCCKPCPRNLVDCRTRCTTPIETRKLVAIWALHAEHMRIIEQEAKNSSLVGCTGLLSAMHPCVLVACAAAKFLLQWAKGSEIVLVPGAMFCAFGELVLLKLLVDRGKFLTHFLDQKNSWKSVKNPKFLDLQIFSFLEQPCFDKSFILSPPGSFATCKIAVFFFVFSMTIMPCWKFFALLLFFSLPLRRNKGLPFIHQIDEKLHTLSKNTEEIEANISMAGGNLNVFHTGGIWTGSSHSIWFDLPQTLPFFPQHRGAARGDIHASLQKSICFPAHQSPIRFCLANTAVCLGIWNDNAEKDLPWRSSLFFVYLGFIVTTCLECKIWQKGYQSHNFKESVPQKLINLFPSATISSTTYDKSRIFCLASTKIKQTKWYWETLRKKNKMKWLICHFFLLKNYFGHQFHD